MASDVWLISDTHWWHRNIIKYCNRPFASVEEMNEALIANWNSVVKPEDTVWHLGDVCINRRALPLMGRCNGVKHLILGNHDNLRLEEYAVYFTWIGALRIMSDMILTHIPVHPSQLHRFKANIHGHIHEKNLDDPHYINVSVEQINYTPIHLDEIKARVKKLS